MGSRWGIRWGKAGKIDPEAVTLACAEGAQGEIASPDGAWAASAALRTTAGELGTVLEESEGEIGRLASNFEEMARATHGMVESAAAILGCSEGERMQPVVAGVQELGESTGRFLNRRVEATAEIVAAVRAEAGLLRRLAELTQRQKAIVKEIGVLRVLTNIEVARLGDVGSGFEYLAHELDDFARAVADSIGDLTRHTEERRAEIEATRQALELELPAMREESLQLDSGLGRAMAQMDATLAQLAETPARFQACIGEIGQQIAGVVAAIQANDITRQQTEHVGAALSWIAGELDAGGEERGAIQAGLTIQNYQLRSIRATVEGWTGQIRACLEGIARIAASEILDLGRGVLGQERELESELARIGRVEEQCVAGNAKLDASFAGASGLMQLVTEHLARSRTVRERLQLLMFNSIVEASHLGARADGILEISNTIKRLSEEWSTITAQSADALEEIAALVERSRAAMESVSGAALEELRAAQARTGAGLEVLREAATCAESRGQEIQSEAEGLQGCMAEVRHAVEVLEGCFARLTRALEEVEAAQLGAGVAGQLPTGMAEAEVAAIEQRYGSSYTTEMERAVLRAALAGAPLPAIEQTFAGNSVELF